MDVRVADVQHQPAGLTLATRFALLPSPAVYRAFTHQGLSEPEAEALLSDPPWTF